MAIASQSLDSKFSLLRAGALSPEEVIKASEVLKVFIRSHRQRSHQWCWQKIGITKRSFYRFLAVGRWSKKVKNLVKANQEPLSQTAIFRLADKKRQPSKLLYQEFCSMLQHLKNRKRKMLKRVKENAIDKLGRLLKAKKSGPKYLIKGKLNGESVSYSSNDLKASSFELKKINGLIIETVTQLLPQDERLASDINIL